MIFRSISLRGALASAALVASALIAGCATYPESYYVEDDRYGGDYYVAEDRYDDPYWGVYAYDSILWPTYRWYDPWYAPGHYYGVNWSPHWYGFSFGYGGHYSPWAYHHYAPYRASWWDNHRWYGGASWRHGYRDERSGYRYGSARNEAERIARREGLAREDARVQRDALPDVRRGDVSRDPRYGVAYGRRGGAIGDRGYGRGIDYGDRAEVDPRDARYEARDDAWRADALRERERRDAFERARAYDRTRDAPIGLDGRRYAGQRPDGYGRVIRHDRADAHARGRDATPYHDVPSVRYAPAPRSDPGRYAPRAEPRYVAPSSSNLGGAPHRPMSAPRSFDAPRASPPPRVDFGGRASHGGSRSRDTGERDDR